MRVWTLPQLVYGRTAANGDDYTEAAHRHTVSCFTDTTANFRSQPYPCSYFHAMADSHTCSLSSVHSVTNPYARYAAGHSAFQKAKEVALEEYGTDAVLVKQWGELVWDLRTDQRSPGERAVLRSSVLLSVRGHEAVIGIRRSLGAYANSVLGQSLNRRIKGLLQHLIGRLAKPQMVLLGEPSPEWPCDTPQWRVDNSSRNASPEL